MELPLTPAENRIKVAVRAGEKLFPGSMHEYASHKLIEQHCE